MLIPTRWFYTCIRLHNAWNLYTLIILLKAEGVFFIQISKYLRINKEINVWQT